jgi:hypothetical protein
MKKLIVATVVFVAMVAGTHAAVTEGWYQAKIKFTQVWERNLLAVEFIDDPASEFGNVSEKFTAGIYTGEQGANQILAMCLTAISLDKSVLVYVQPVDGFVKIVSVAMVN